MAMHTPDGGVQIVDQATREDGVLLDGHRDRLTSAAFNADGTRLITKVGRGKEQRVRWRAEPDPLVASEGLRAEGFAIVAVELTPTAEPYFEIEWPERTCLVVGHEDHGVTRKVLAAVDRSVFIPMYGKGASLNVHVALAVVAFRAQEARLP
jgi:tRNA G18 (ribose-2'-O)-methylase SpoU